MAKQKQNDSRSTASCGLLTLMHRGLRKLGKWLFASSVVQLFVSYDEMKDYAASSLTVGGSRRVAQNLKKKLTKKPRRELGTESISPNEVGVYVPASLPRSLKNRISESLEGSFILRKLTEFLQKLLQMPMMYYGVFLFSFGLFTTVSQAMLYFWLRANDVSAALDLFVGLALVLLSLMVMFKGYEPLMDSLWESQSGNFIVRMFNDRPKVELPRKKHHSAGLFFAAGMLLGLFTLATPPLHLIAMLLFDIFVIGVFFVPEVGMCALLFALPLLNGFSVSARVPVMAILYIGACLLLKVMIGKRSITLGFIDGWVLLFLTIVLSTAHGDHPAAKDSALLYAAMIAGYFILTNLMRSALWIRRAMNAMSLSAFVVSLIGILCHFLPVDYSFRLGTADMTPTLYLLTVIPITLVTFICSETPKTRFGYLGVLTAEITYLVLLDSTIGLLALAAELLFFFLFYTRKTWTVLLLMLLSLPLVSYWMWPDFSGLWERATHSARGQIWMGLGEVFGFAPLSGVGMNDGVLRQALQNFMGNPHANLVLSNTYLRILVQVGIPGLVIFAIVLLLWYVSGFTLLRKCGTKEKNTVMHLGVMASLTGVILAGNLVYLWSDSWLLLLFWLCAGIARALRRLARRNEDTTDSANSEVVRDGIQCVDVEIYYADSSKKD